MPVAVKQLLRVMSVDVDQEMKILQRISHKNVVRLHAYTADASFRYLVLERCDSSLDEAVLGGKSAGRGSSAARVEMVDKATGQPTEACVEIVEGVLRGMEELHSRGVVHRDLKPSNVLLVREQGGGRLVAKIADLGLGKPLEDGQSSFMSARAGGTQCWQAPEQMDPPPGEGSRVGGGGGPVGWWGCSWALWSKSTCACALAGAYLRS